MRNPLRSLKAPAPAPAAALPIPHALAAAIDAVKTGVAARDRVLKLKSDLVADVERAKAISAGAADRLNQLMLDVALAEGDAAKAELQRKLKAARDEATEAQQTIENFDRVNAGIAARLAKADEEIAAATEAFEPELHAFRRDVIGYLDAQLQVATEHLGEALKLIHATETGIFGGVGALRRFDEEIRIPRLADHRRPILSNGALFNRDGEGVKLATAWTDEPALLAWREQHREIGQMIRTVAEHRQRLAKQRDEAWLRAGEEAREKRLSAPGDAHHSRIGSAPRAEPAPAPRNSGPQPHSIRTPGTRPAATALDSMPQEVGITGPHRIAPETGEHG